MGLSNFLGLRSLVDNMVQHLVTGVFRQLVWRTGHDRMVIVRVTQTHPRQLDAELEVRQVQESTVVVLRRSPHPDVKVAFEHHFSCANTHNSGQIKCVNCQPLV